MGLEAECTVHYGERVSAGRALLETSELLFRGDLRLAIPFADIAAVEAARGQLSVTFPGGTAVFDLGRRAEQWALKIRYPSPLLDKLGVKQDTHVTVVGIDAADFDAQLRRRTKEVATTREARDQEIVFLGTMSVDDLGQIEGLIPCIRRNGAIWVVYPKGKQHIREADVMAAGKAAGLVDVKIVSFSDTHSALKFVIPLAER